MNRDLAIVGMVCKTPGAENLDDFWTMLCDGSTGLRALTPDEISQSKLKMADNTIFAGGFIEGIDQFDPEFFGYTARDAAYMDPQHRLFLQACWQTLEVSGTTGHNVGVFASAGFNAYLTEVLLQQGLQAHQYQSSLIGNSLDCLATRVSYCLNLSGPSMTIQSGCSSSLVALHQARLALLSKQCDAALVGGVSIAIPHYQGYTPVEGGFSSTDGHCRPFSIDASGTVFSSGYAVVLIKRLSDAIEEGDLIYSVVKGTAVNNDGSDKASFTAPSVQGQADVIAKALRVADVAPETIQYIETHGTGTPIGDPIEFSALNQVFNTKTKRCVLGSVKANIGHLDVAAGMIGLIKTSLMLYFKTITPQIHFKNWNERIIEKSHPFIITSSVHSWDALVGVARRAGVSSFGFGGTNAHVILEETTHQGLEAAAFTPYSSLIVLSAKSKQRLLAWTQALGDFLSKNPLLPLANLAYTLQTARKQWPCRLVLCVSTTEELIQKLAEVLEHDITVCSQTKPLIDRENLNIHSIKQYWLDGVQIDWRQFYSEPMLKCKLPSAPLDMDSYWLTAEEKPQTIDPAFEKRVGQYDKWIYRQVWHEVLVSPATESATLDATLIIGNGHSSRVQAFIARCTIAGIAYCLLEPGNQYLLKNECHVQMDMNDPESFVRIEANWARLGFKPTRIIHWIEAPKQWEACAKMSTELLGIVTKSSLIRKIAHVVYVVSGLSDLFCIENHPVLSLMLALSRGVRQEWPHLDTKLIDLALNSSNEHDYQQIMTGYQDNSLQDYLVWRDQMCWQLGYQTIQLPIRAKNPVYFKQRGLYLITGGFGNVASVYVEFLASDYQATLVLLGRTPIPDEKTWSEHLANPNTSIDLKKKIERLVDWKSRGFSIVPYQADVTKEEELVRVCQSVTSIFGSIDGVIHIAGAGSDMHYKMLADLSSDHCWQLFSPKLKGIYAIGSVMSQFNIPDCVVISSISSALAGIGLAAYAASHNLLDAFVKKEYPTWRVMNWDAWNFHMKLDANQSLGALGAGMDKLAITPHEGLMVLREAFSIPYWQQIFISTIDLKARLQQWVNRFEQDKPKKQVTRFARPTLRSEYVAASTPLQQQLADVWADLIGVGPIGIHDNFFELGGDSLHALELIQQLQTGFNFACSVMDLFEASTIVKLAEKISPDLRAIPKRRFDAARARSAKQRAVLIDNNLV